MESLPFIARFMLAIIFLFAGLGKLADLTGGRNALIHFGIPKAIAGSLAVLLPLGEILIAGALLTRSAAWLGALFASVLLAIFTLAIGVAVVRGQNHECHCFGQFLSTPVSWITFVRTLLLLFITCMVVWLGRTDTGFNLIEWVGSLHAQYQVLLVGVLLIVSICGAQSWLLFHLLGQQGRLLLRIESLEQQRGETPTLPIPLPIGLPIGAAAPEFNLPGLSGQMVSLTTLLIHSHPTLLIFSDPNCRACVSLEPEIAEWHSAYTNFLTIAVISQGIPAAHSHTATANRPPVLLQHDREVAQSYQILGTPSGILIQPDGTIGSAPITGADAIRKFVSRIATATLDRTARIPARKSTNDGNAYELQPFGIGQLAPQLQIPDLAGAIVDLTKYRGHPVLLLFWDPHCRFCASIQDDLIQVDQALPLLVISVGTKESNRSLNLRAPIMLDNSLATAHTFGVTGVPSALLLDDAGRIAALPAFGAAAVAKRIEEYQQLSATLSISPIAGVLTSSTPMRKE